MSLTITATASGSGSSNGILLAPQVFTGASATQDGVTAASESVTVPALAITPGAAGSVVVGAVGTGASATAFSNPTGHATSVANSTVVTGTRWGVYRSGATSGRARTYGWNTPAQDSGNIFIAQAEIVAAGELDLDASTPAVASASGAKTATSDSFTPPDGAVIVVPVIANWSGSGDVSIAVSDSAGAYTWTERVDSGTADLVSIWVGISDAVTLSVAASLAAMAPEMALGVPVTLSVAASLSAMAPEVSLVAEGAPPGYPDGPLDALLELYLGSWVDVTTAALPAGQQSGTLKSGQAAGAQQLTPAALPVALDNPGGDYSPRNDSGPYSGQLKQNTPARFSFASPYGVYLRLEDDGPSYASVADTPELHVTGSLELRIGLQLSDWRGCCVAARYGASGTPSWIWGIQDSGIPEFGWHDAVGTPHAAYGTAALPYLPGKMALRVALDAATGTVAFYYADGIDSMSWTQLGDAVVSGATSVIAGDQPLTVGYSAYGGVLGQLHGQVTAFRLYDGITVGSTILDTAGDPILDTAGSPILDTSAPHVVADAGFTAQVQGTSTWTDAYGRAWLLSGLAEFSSRDYRLFGELGSIVPQSASTGGAKAALAVAGRTRRMQQGRAPAIASPFKRAVLGLDALEAYWPMEESGASGAFGAAVGSSLMSYAVNGSPGSVSAFECSGALPQLGTVGGPSGTVDAYTGGTAWTARFLLKLGTVLPSSGTSNIAFVFSTGAVGQLNLDVDPDGALYLRGVSGATQVFSVGPLTWVGLTDGVLCSIEATAAGSGQVKYNLMTMRPGDTEPQQLPSPPLIMGTFGNVTGIQFNSVTPALSDTVAGHAFAQSAWTDMADLAQPLNAWRNELAAARFARVSAENSVGCRIIGSPGVTVAMGPQPEGTLWQVYKDIAWAEQGLLYEPREVLGIGLRTRASMIGQPPAATFSFAAANLPGSMLAADDDTDLINDLTAKLPDGTTYRVELNDWSANSVSELPVGRGRYAANAPLPFNVAEPSLLPDRAAWYLRVCTTDAARYRQVGADFGMPGAPTEAMARLRHGDRITITDVPAVYQTADIEQIATGTTEAFGPGRAPLWDCIPYLPYSTPAPSGTGGISGGGSGGGTGGGGTVPVPGYTQDLIDDFSSGSLSPDIWREPVNTDGISVSDGKLVIRGITDDEQVVALQADGHDLSTGIFGLQLEQTGTTDPGTMWFLGLDDQALTLGNYYEWQTFPLNGSGSWYSWADGSGATTSGDTGAQDILGLSTWVNGNWLGIGNYGLNGGNDVHVYRSSDGANWTEIASFQVTGAVDESNLYFYFGTNYNPGSGSSDYIAKVANVSFFERQASSGTGEPVSLFGDGSGIVDTVGAYGGTIGVEIAATESGTVNGVYLSAPDGIGLTSLPTQIGLWRADAATLVTSQSATWGEPDEFGRVFAPFDPAPTMSGATDYMATAFGAAGSFGYTSSASWPVTSGPLTGIDGGFYSTDDSMDYPSSQQSGWSFGLDASFTPTGTISGGGGGGGDSGLQLAVYESGGNFPEPGPAAWPFGNATTTAVEYFAWGQPLTGDGSMGAFIAKCIANGLKPCVEIEAWHAGDGWNETPTYDDIMGGAWDTWLESAGTVIAAAAVDVTVIIIHEFNISGQYPWSWNANATIGYGSGPGGADLTPPQWIDLWSYIKAKVNSTAGGHAKWMWACAADTGGTSISPADYWPASDLPDYVGVDGYPKTTYAEEQGFFAGEFQATFDIIRGLGWAGPDKGIVLAEINLPQMESTGGERIEDFVADMAAAGVIWLIEFDDTAGWGLAAISADQVSRLLTAVAANY